MTKFKEGPLVLLLRDGKVEEFNRAARQTESVDLSGANLRGVDLRYAHLCKADLSNAYCHTADLRGVDLLHANIEGASFHRARISGAYFPRGVSAEELKMLVGMGTRIRLLQIPGQSVSAGTALKIIVPLQDTSSASHEHRTHPGFPD